MNSFIIDYFQSFHNSVAIMNGANDWQCDYCIFANEACANICVACGQRKQLLINDATNVRRCICSDVNYLGPSICKYCYREVTARQENGHNWECRRCTLINESSSKSCSLCHSAKPIASLQALTPPPMLLPMTLCQTYTDSTLYEGINLAESENENDSNMPPSRTVASQALQNYNGYSIRSNERFACSSCFKQCDAEDGIILQNCRHTFCKYCLRNAVLYNNLGENLECPSKNGDYECGKVLQEQEIDMLINYTDRKLAYPGVYVKTETMAEIIALESQDLITNVERFECPVCMTNYEPGEGVVMRDCLHIFCKDCLKQAIKCNEEAEMKCPFGDGEFRCQSILQDREIKALVDAEVYQKYLNKSITEAESKIKNSFHCKTVDCVGWCVYDEGVSRFYCPVCRKTNCINCKVIHEGLDCKQYQDKLIRENECNAENAKSENKLQEMVRKGEAMACPTCAIILTKIVGCDWLCCSMCKTEICWATRGPRWGPRGRGDTSAGCRCRINGKLCHPGCGNCH